MDFQNFLDRKLHLESKTLSEDKLVDFMGETWTYDGKNMFEAVLQQVKGAHIIKNNDLTAKKNFVEALECLQECYNKNNPINGFVWQYEAVKFFDDHKEALSEFYDNDGKGCGEIELLIENLAKKDETVNAIFDLVFDDGSQVKTSIIHNFVLQVASDLCNTSMKDYYEAGVINENEVSAIMQQENAESATNIRRKR